MSLEVLTTLSSLLLTILTAVYVFLTYRMMRESTQATSASQKAVEQLFRILTAPYLYCQVGTQDNRATLAVSNTGNAPAYDVDIFALGIYAEEDEDVHSFMVKYARPDFSGHPLSADDEGFYGVFDRCWYPIFPHRRKTDVELDFPVCPSSMHLLLQYRDSSGTNFSYIYWLFKGLHDAVYRVGHIAPAQAIPSSRVLFDLDRNLVVEGGQPFPEHVDKDFVSIWDHSIPSGWLITSSGTGVEDRGEWSYI